MTQEERAEIKALVLRAIHAALLSEPGTDVWLVEGELVPWPTSSGAVYAGQTVGTDDRDSDWWLDGFAHEEADGYHGRDGERIGDGSLGSALHAAIEAGHCPTIIDHWIDDMDAGWVEN